MKERARENARENERDLRERMRESVRGKYVIYNGLFIKNKNMSE